MDEVENPNLPAAGESSPTLRPMDEDEDTDVPADIAAAEGLAGTQGAAALPQPTYKPVPTRPGLQRNISSQPPPSQPPPAPPSDQELPQEPPDSLTLADLKRLRSAFPNAQAAPKEQLLDYERVYDFSYQDAQSFPVELEEWFSYSELEEHKLRVCKRQFNDAWRAGEHGSRDWLDVTEDARRAFVEQQIASFKDSEEPASNRGALQSLTYLALGVWEETAGRRAPCALEDLFVHGGSKGGSRLEAYQSTGLQIQWILAMVHTINACGGLKPIYEKLQQAVDAEFAYVPLELPSRNETNPQRPEESLELWCCLTLLYLFIEVARTTGGADGQALKQSIIVLEPNLLHFLTQIVGRLRWDETAPIPLTKMLLLSWKTVLVSFGGIKDVESFKACVREDKHEIDARGQPIITASPLDYHLFRQEINSKYPAYQPPPPLFPLEPENNSILPPLKHRRPSYALVGDSGISTAPNVGTHSIMHQPVHIATPAPSPPPSPAGPGKPGKKQNYQTNQMFPFLYPPLDPTSNDLGGKGSTELQDALVGRKWQGSDIPASILEAAELFAKRMRATRAMKQLWEARVDFMKYERGWKSGTEADNDVDDFELLPTPAPDEVAEQGQPVAQTKEQKKLEMVDRFYRESLPHFQSVVIVLLKAVLQNVTDLVTKTNGQNGLQSAIQFNEPNGPPNGAPKPAESGANGHVDSAENSAEELDRLRSQEIAAKALSAILLLLLKWFKVSHILQYEYMTQLLLDSNYVPLILKLWQTQDTGRACHYQLDKEASNFFYFCQATSRQGPPRRPDGQQGKQDAAEESEDEAAPPPIKLRRDDPEHPVSPTASDSVHPPEVDELGYPQTPLPESPIKIYSYRNTFSAINYLRILQKITRRKTHRALLLVSYKSSNHLKKTLKIPIELLRYYTLKLFKSQVPFCGRKWRQGNMKIITAVWLSVPAELRDDWLTGGGGGMGGACVGDVDGTVEDALPLEQSLRALTHWWNVRCYPEVMGIERGLLEEEMDFFGRELERMEVGRLVEEEQMGEEPGVGEGGEQWQGPIEGY